MTYDELNVLLRKNITPVAIKPFKTLIDAGFNHLTPTDFEAFVLGIFEALNFSGSLTPASGDGGADILLKSTAGPIAVQCKKYDDNTTIGSRELREFLGTIVHFRAVHGYYVTTSSFTIQAKEFTNEHNNITLIDGEYLKKLFFLSISSSIAPPDFEAYSHDASFLVQAFQREVEGPYQRGFNVGFRKQAEEIYNEFVGKLEELRKRFRRA